MVAVVKKTNKHTLVFYSKRFVIIINIENDVYILSTYIYIYNVLLNIFYVIYYIMCKQVNLSK